ncbi:MAG: hypothetical protein JNL90_00355 [Planctomycetes bacterium]|nr:hypothetical protein [Planctomycetota bacterium]
MFDWLIAWFEEQIVQQWLQTLGAAAVTATLLQVFGAIGSSSRSSVDATASLRGGATAAGLALAFLAGLFTVIGSLPGLPPAERWQWSAWLALATLLLLLFEESHGAAAALRFVLHVALVAALAWWIVRPSGRAREWSPLDAQLVYLGGGLALLLFLLLGESRATRQPAWRSLLPMVLAAATAVACFAEQSDKLARCAGGLFAALLVTLLLSLVRPAATLPRSAIATPTLAFAGLLAYCFAARYVSSGATLLLGVAWGSLLLPSGEGRPRRTLLVAIAVPLAACIGAWLMRSPS